MLLNLTMEGSIYQIYRYTDCTAPQILSAIDTAFAGADSDDVSLFYYMGHGSATTNSYAGALTGIETQAYTTIGFISPTALRDALAAVPGTVIVLLDSCGSGSYIDDRDLSGSEEPVSIEDARAFNDAVIAAFSQSAGRTGELLSGKFKVLTACEYNALSYTSIYGASVFTSALTGGGWYDDSTNSLSADGNHDGIVTLDEEYRYIYNHTDTDEQVVQVYPTGSDYPLFRRD
jgi:uncharacterized caspase-like protein